MGRFVSNGVDDAVSCGTGSTGSLSIFVAGEQLEDGAYERIERIRGCCRGR